MKIRGWLLGGFLFMLGVIFVFLTLQLDRINIGLSSVGSRLTTVEDAAKVRMADPAQVARDLTTLRTDLQQLRTELATTQGRIASVEASNQVSDVKASLDVIQTEIAGLSENLGALLGAIQSLNQQIDALLQGGAAEPSSNNNSSQSSSTQAVIGATGQGCTTALDWTRASEFADQEISRSFEGPIVAAIHAASSENPVTIFHIGSHGPERLQPWIAEANRANFSGAPEETFAGKTVCVTGVIEWYQNGSGENIATIELIGPEQIAVIE